MYGAPYAFAVLPVKISTVESAWMLTIWLARLGSLLIESVPSDPPSISKPPLEMVRPSSSTSMPPETRIPPCVTSKPPPATVKPDKVAEKVHRDPANSQTFPSPTASHAACVNGALSHVACMAGSEEAVHFATDSHASWLAVWSSVIGTALHSEASAERTALQDPRPTVTPPLKVASPPSTVKLERTVRPSEMMVSPFSTAKTPVSTVSPSSTASPPLISTPPETSIESKTLRPTDGGVYVHPGGQLAADVLALASNAATQSTPCVVATPLHEAALPLSTVSPPLTASPPSMSMPPLSTMSPVSVIVTPPDMVAPSASTVRPPVWMVTRSSDVRPPAIIAPP